jgi:aerobic-type carbon monoxide dehydrogenase small subunit (CoxS/CutS family)
VGAARRARHDRTKFGCGMALCGARTVDLDGAAACDLPIRVEQLL